MEARKVSSGVKPYRGDPLDDEDARVALHNYITSIGLKDGPRMSQSYQTLMSLMPSEKFIEFIMDEAIRSFSNKWIRIAKELFYLVLDFDPGYELAQQYIDTIQVYQSVSPQMTKKLDLFSFELTISGIIILFAIMFIILANLTETINFNIISVKKFIL